MSAVLQSAEGFGPMREDDLDAVIAIEGRTYEFPWTLINFRDSIRAGYSCWVCRGRHEGLIGYGVMMLAAGEGHLLNLTVDKPYQRRGYGGGFLRHLITTARDYGAQRVFLEVRPSNDAGIDLYARQGFHQIGVRRDYYPARHGREDALVLALEF